MNKNDKLVGLGVIAFLAPFFIFPALFDGFNQLTAEHAFFMSGVKFAVLATFGEVLGKRISTSSWSIQGFGVLPKMVVWFLLGIVIKMAFVVFAAGDPIVLSKFVNNPHPLLVAISISLGLNLIFAPIFMTLHKITDMHIGAHKGKLSALWQPIDIATMFTNINWQVQYGFVFKKTIPLFWIPAHTITFMLPANFQVLFAAMLGVALGVILAIAGKQTPTALTPSAS